MCDYSSSNELNASLQNVWLLQLNWIECIIAKCLLTPAQLNWMHHCKMCDYSSSIELNASLQNVWLSILSWIECIIAINWIECIIAINWIECIIAKSVLTPPPLNWMHHCYQLNSVHHCKICDYSSSVEWNASLQYQNISSQLNWMQQCKICLIFSIELNVSLQKQINPSEPGLGIRSFPHRSFAHFAQIKWATVSDLLRLLKTNEQPWAKCSGRSEEMSDHKRIAQVAQDKWVTMSDSLRSLRGNEQINDPLNKFWLNKSKILFLVCFIYDF